MNQTRTISPQYAFDHIMSYQKNVAPNHNSLDFRSFIWTQKKYLVLAAVCSTIQFIILKQIYPFPDFISDSYNYIWAAKTNAAVSLWPIGYAKFLILASLISSSASFLIISQYFMAQLALTYLILVVWYIYRPSQITRNIMFIALIGNPAILYLSNCVLSDTLFMVVTILWFTDLLWLTTDRKKKRLLSQAAIIGIAVSIRYTALYYPIISTVVLFTTYRSISLQLLALVVPWMCIIPFIIFTENVTNKITGHKQFSVFGAWQIANNALYMYHELKIDSAKLPPETKELDRWVRAYHAKVDVTYTSLSEFPGTYFIKHSDGPLKQYMRYKFRGRQDSLNGFQSWGSVAPTYQKYGQYLIRTYPVSFLKHYILLNIYNYGYPFLEKFEVYNYGDDTVGARVKEWFNLKTNRITSLTKTAQSNLFLPLPAIWLLLNLFDAGLIFGLIIKKITTDISARHKKAFILFQLYLIVNFLFSVSATPIVIRYQLTPAILLTILSLLSLETLKINKR